jgi:hypothetical protein
MKAGRIRRSPDALGATVFEVREPGTSQQPSTWTGGRGLLICPRSDSWCLSAAPLFFLVPSCTSTRAASSEALSSSSLDPAPVNCCTNVANPPPADYVTYPRTDHAMTRADLQEPWATVRRWEHRHVLRRGVRDASVLGTTVLLLLGGGLILWWGRSEQDPFWAPVGLLAILVASLLALAQTAFAELRPRRASAAKPFPPDRITVGEHLPPDLLEHTPLSLPSQRFVHLLPAIDKERWSRILLLADGLGLMDGRTPWPAVDVRLRANRLVRADRAERGSADPQLVETLEALQGAEVAAEYEESRTVLDHLVATGDLPFAPPYAEYRLALRGLHGIVAARGLPENCTRVLGVFDTILETDLAKTLCSAPGAPRGASGGATEHDEGPRSLQS